MPIDELIIDAAAGYILLGVSVWLVFLIAWIGRVDAAAAHAPWRLRLLWTPGGVILWPVLLGWIARTRRNSR